MAQYKFNKNSKYVMPKSGQYAVRERGAAFIRRSEFESQPTPPGRSTVDDATWDKAMMEVMQEYDEAWTQLADK